MGLRIVAWIWFGFLLVGTAYVGPVCAQLSPGELAAPHADLEGLSNCTSCHAVGERVPDEKCLDCHKEIRQRQVQTRGYHVQVGDQACVACHSDHNGRDYEMIRWPNGSQDAFDHQLTGYVLEGRHDRAVCRDCHRADRVVDPEIRAIRAASLNHTFLGLATECAGCHTDVHRGQLGSDCAACHSMAQWKPAAKFQHDRARFVLGGRHADLACGRCHPEEQNGDGKAAIRFRPVDFEGCAPCHADPHKGHFAQPCDACHVATDWHMRKGRIFDHGRTRFALVEKHQQVTCKACHGEGQAWRLPAFDRCAACHTDVHAGQFDRAESDGACERCHNETGFLPSLFDVEAHQKTRFKLEGAHLAVPCLLCHRRDTPDAPIQFSWTESTFQCATCHTSPHRGQFAQRIEKSGCEGCHRVASWFEVPFDHDRTSFPLMGRHQGVPCGRCHPVGSDAKGNYRQFALQKMTCEACHRDIHERQFREGQQTDCAQCHTTKAWRADLFQHDRDARFELSGAHRDVACGKCHSTVVFESGVHGVRYRPLEVACATCHVGM